MFTVNLGSSITYFKAKETKSCSCRQLLQTSTESHSRICCFSSPAPDTTQRSMRPDSTHKLEKIEGRKRLCTSTAPQCLAFCRLEAACQHLRAAKATYSESIHPSDHDHSLLNTKDPPLPPHWVFALPIFFFCEVVVENLKARIIIFMNPIVRSR